jgi:hypothetical protein
MTAIVYQVDFPSFTEKWLEAPQVLTPAVSEGLKPRKIQQDGTSATGDRLDVA